MMTDRISPLRRKENIVFHVGEGGVRKSGPEPLPPGFYSPIFSNQ
jgi:hypothetical protein